MTLGLEQAGVDTYSIGFSDTLEQREYLHDVFQNDNEYAYEHGVKRTLYQGKNYFTKILNNLYMAFSLFIRMFSYVSKEKTSYIIIPTQPIEVTLPSLIIGKIFGVDVISNAMEYYPALPAYNVKKNILIRWSWKLVVKYSDSFIVISDFLLEKMNKITKKKKMILPAILPVSTGNEKDAGLENNKDEFLFVYTSSPAYEDLLDFTLESLAKIKGREFILVITGKYTDSALSHWSAKINELHLVDKVEFCGFLSEQDLINIQKKSDALLIPLIDNDRHKARFPQKSLGYMQLGHPIVTTNVGELARYFKDGDTAVMDGSVTTEGFAEKIQSVLDDRVLSRKIGLRGKKYVESYFNAEKWGRELKDFMTN